MNHHANGDENRESRTAENWLSTIARVYGGWHLGITAIQIAVWTVFVYWNESGKRDALADVVQTTVGEVAVAVPAASILSIIILAGIQKGGGIMVTFIDKRRKRIETAREEGREEMRAMMRVEIEKAREEGLENHAAWTAWNSRRIDAERRGERFDEPPPSLNGR